MNILEKLNKDFQIEVRDDIAYDMQIDGNVIATSRQALIQFYIDSFKYKIECLFDDETETRKNYEDTIQQLKKLLCENCIHFYECDNMGTFEECLSDMKFYEAENSDK